MIEKLKKLVTQKTGFEVKSLKDSILLSELIELQINEQLNYNTIRRFFGVVSSTTPRRATLDILSRFAGYSSYAAYCIKHPITSESITNEASYQIAYSKDLKVIESHLRHNADSPKFIFNIVIVARELLHQKRFKEVQHMFKMDILDYYNFNYSDVIFIGNSIGAFFKQNTLGKINPNDFDINFIRMIYLIYVDYSSLNGYYGQWSKALTVNNNEEVRVFSQCVTILADYLNQKKLGRLSEQIQTSSFHPILQGRILSMELLRTNNETQRVKLLDAFFNTKRNKEKVPSTYLLEIMTCSLFSRSFVVMSWIVNNIERQVSKHLTYEDSHFNILFLVQIIHNHKFGITNSIKVIHDIQNDLFINNSYTEIMSIFAHIFNYHNTHLSEKDKVLKNYLALSAKLNYSLFSEEYLITYFDT